MQRESITKLQISDFNTTIQDKQIIILYPQTAYRTLFLSYLLDNDNYRLLYYRLKSDTLTEMLAGLVEEYGAAFSKTIKKDLQSTDPEKQAIALTQALASYDETTVLYLDELDRLQLDDAYQQFFVTLAANLSSQTKIMLNARALTTEPWKQLVLDQQAVVIGTERRQSQLMFTADDADKPQLEIYAFGRGHAIINGSPVESWDGALPRHLFFYFIDRDLITRDEIFKTFWADLGVKEATNVYHVTKRKISERLSLNVQDAENYELTEYSAGFYRPADKIARHYDVAEFEAAVDEASMTFDDDQQAALYRRAIDLYRAPFLLTIDMPWVHDRREKLQRLFLEALIGLARIHKAAGRNEAALGYFMRAIHEKPLREDIHREVMSLYTKLGYTDEAVHQYQQLEVLVQDLVGVPPAPETQALLQQIQN